MFIDNKMDDNEDIRFSMSAEQYLGKNAVKWLIVYQKDECYVE